ncbi:putative MPP superfamily phosphohydrolase [Bacilli bacterium PM5-9]|nr:putative MPP superfamily phosphohydrolase [Bacilli bacterium PM5-9]
MNKKILISAIAGVSVIIIIFFIFFYSPSQYKNKITTNTHKINAFSTKSEVARIVVFSDLHLLYDYKVTDLKKVVDKINGVEPDIVIFNGDLFDNKSYQKNKTQNTNIIKTLKELQPIYGKFAILGDQDNANKDASKILVDSDFEILTNTARNIKINSKHFNIIGLYNNGKQTSVLKKLNDKTFNFTLSHSPEIIESIKNYKINTIVTSHTLGGQYNIPIYGSIFSNIKSVPYYKGYSLVNEIGVYNTNGIGIYQSSMRFMAPSSIELFILN